MLGQRTLAALTHVSDWAVGHAGPGALVAAAHDLSAGRACPEIVAGCEALLTLAADEI